MVITQIDWLDQNNREAIVTIADSKHSITCFADDLKYKIGDRINENLNALDIKEVKKISNNNHPNIKMKDTFNCQIIGKLCNKKIGDGVAYF